MIAGEPKGSDYYIVGEMKKLLSRSAMTLEFEQAITVLEEHIEILKQNLRFFVANYKAEYTSQIVAIKRQLDKAVQKKMKLSQIYHRSNNKNRVAVSAAA